MKVTVVGAGYVGLVSGSCLAKLGHEVTIIDIDKSKIASLNRGAISIYEPELDKIISDSVKLGRLKFESEYDSIVDADIAMIAVGTPSSKDGSCDLSYVLDAARKIAVKMKERLKEPLCVCVKSTVPVGTNKLVRDTMQIVLGPYEPIYVASNPEFLREGSAVNDFMKPDRIVIGVSNADERYIMTQLYDKFDHDYLFITNIQTAEMIKYASNSMLATKISFMSDIARLCDETGCDVKDVAEAMGMDERIGRRFLDAGCGYGGSCFPKDVKALIDFGRKNGVEMHVAIAAEKSNEEQKHQLSKKLMRCMLDHTHPMKKVAVLGLAFKPNTNDIREACSITFMQDVLGNSKFDEIEELHLWDPQAIPEYITLFHDKRIAYHTDIYEACQDADCVVICTEWQEVKELFLPKLKKIMRNHSIVDGRNCIDKTWAISLGFDMYCMGR